MTEYGAVGAGYWGTANDLIWSDEENKYVQKNIIKNSTIPSSDEVLQNPCITYAVDKKYYKSLGLEDPL